MTVPVKITEPATIQGWGLPVDAITGAVLTIPYPEHEIEEGNSYTAHFTNTTTSDDDHRSVLALTTPSGPRWIRLIFSVTATHPADAIILEGPTTIDKGEGTEVTVFNRNRNSDNTSVALSIEAPPVSGLATTFTEAQIAGATLAGGTQLEHRILAGGDGSKAIGGVSRDSSAWVLQSDTTYLFYLQNIGANENTHHINLDFFEHGHED